MRVARDSDGDVGGWRGWTLEAAEEATAGGWREQRQKETSKQVRINQAAAHDFTLSFSQRTSQSQRSSITYIYYRWLDRRNNCNQQKTHHTHSIATQEKQNLQNDLMHSPQCGLSTDSANDLQDHGIPSSGESPRSWGQFWPRPRFLSGRPLGAACRNRASSSQHCLCKETFSTGSCMADILRV